MRYVPHEITQPQNPETMITEMPGMLAALNMALTHLLTEAEKGGPKMGTALTSAIGEVEVHGRSFQIQMRIEADPKSFIGENEVLQSQTLNSIGGN